MAAFGSLHNYKLPLQMQKNWLVIVWPYCCSDDVVIQPQFKWWFWSVTLTLNSLWRTAIWSWRIKIQNYRGEWDFIWGVCLRCFDTVFERPYRYFSIALKVVFSLSDRYKIFTSNWLWIEICENVVLSKIDITMTTMNKKLWNW